MLLKSFAKLNLYLAVTGKRPDHYHNIRTIFARVSLFDNVILKARRDRSIKISCDSPSVPSGRGNLAFRAAKLLQDDLGIACGADIRIIKCIPVGAGLGGGSSNAASVLVGLNKLWKLELPQRRLLEYARLIGSDVAFFIYGCRFAEGRGRGDDIRPLPADEVRLWQVIAVPPLTVATPFIYGKWDRAKLALTRGVPDVKIMTLALKKRDSSLINKALYNSLEAVAVKFYPAIRRVKDALLEAGAEGVLMSGSGSSVFALVASRKEALLLARRVRAKGKSWRIFVSHTC